MKYSFAKIAILFIISALAISCKKESSLNPNTTYKSDGSPNRKVSSDIRDSVYFYAETAYLWYKNLPNVSVLNPLKLSGPEEVIASVRSFSEKGSDAKNLDRWSFVMDKKAWDAVASGSSSDFGLFYRFASDGNLYVRQVFAKSSAGMQGIERGWKVLTVNGITPVNNDSFLSQFNAALSSNSLLINFEKPDGTQKSFTILDSSYQTNPIQAATVFDYGTKKIGYFAFTDFLGDNTAAGLETVFNDFKAKGVNELVIDLRYNGGGYVSLAQQLGNLIAPTTAQGKVMFTYQYNDKLAAYSTSTKFNVSNKLGLSKVVFITTKNSASASELIINSLKPHMDVKIVGSASHGKPVGFPVIPVMDYVVAPVAFKTANSLGEADYYTGFTPDYPEADDLTKNFGDPNEKCLKVALEYLKTGKVITNSASNARILATEKMEMWNEKLPKTFEGMYTADKEVTNAIKGMLKK
jgi:carboxyl-terminal processing protease